MGAADRARLAEQVDLVVTHAEDLAAAAAEEQAQEEAKGPSAEAIAADMESLRRQSLEDGYAILATPDDV